MLLSHLESDPMLLDRVGLAWSSWTNILSDPVAGTMQEPTKDTRDRSSYLSIHMDKLQQTLLHKIGAFL